MKLLNAELLIKNEQLKQFKALMEYYRKSGRVVSYFPRLHMASLNGGKRITIDEACARMSAVLISQRPVK